MPHRQWKPVNPICCPPEQQKVEHGQWLYTSWDISPSKYVGYLQMALHKVILLMKGNAYVRDTYTSMICANEHYSMRQNYVVGCLSKAQD
jgi:hypothetical protein